jgi:glyoxylase-like metal-dependent hydrolase (beta-lactamase superfamily II)
MIQQERVADNVYFFQSKTYVEVNAGVVAGPDMAVVIDTLPFPEETTLMKEFIARELQVPVKYLINTHYHADHTWGNYLFPEAKIIAHSLCRQLLLDKGVPALAREKEQNVGLKDIQVVVPEITFDAGELILKVGKKNIRMFPLPGHSSDGIAVLVEDDRVLFSGDAVMAVPYIVDGDLDTTVQSMELLAKMGLENVVQGHGDIILRGEIEQIMQDNISYLNEVRKAVKKASRRKYPLDLLEATDIESCGKSRVLLSGLAEGLHQNNLSHLYFQMFGEEPVGSEEYFEEDYN